MKVRHTPGPWRVELQQSDTDTWWRVNGKAWYGLSWFWVTKGDDPHDCDGKANAERAVACVNACDGLPQDWLKDGGLKQLLNDCLNTLQQYAANDHDADSLADRLVGLLSSTSEEATT